MINGEGLVDTIEGLTNGVNEIYCADQSLVPPLICVVTDTTRANIKLVMIKIMIMNGGQIRFVTLTFHHHIL